MGMKKSKTMTRKEKMRQFLPADVYFLWESRFPLRDKRIRQYVVSAVRMAKEKIRNRDV
jgi:hypothetical protein